jgi:hypothetical protein
MFIALPQGEYRKALFIEAFPVYNNWSNTLLYTILIDSELISFIEEAFPTIKVNVAETLSEGSSSLKKSNDTVLFPAIPSEIIAVGSIYALKALVSFPAAIVIGLPVDILRGSVTP